MLLKSSPGHVYIVDFGDKGFKIGKTKNLEQRINDLLRYNNGSVIHTIETNNINRLEKHIHWVYREKRLNDSFNRFAELFSLSDEDIFDLKLIRKVTYTKDEKKVIEEHVKHLLFKIGIDEDYPDQDNFDTALSENEEIFLLKNSNIFDGSDSDTYYRLELKRYCGKKKNGK